MQDRSVPASSVASIDASSGQRICDETDGLLAPTPGLPVLDAVPAELALPVAAPVAPRGAALSGLLVLCTTPLPAAALPSGLLTVLVDGVFVAVAFEPVSADELALLPACVAFDVLEADPATPVVVAVLCARAGVARTADRTRAVVRKRMAVHRCLCRGQSRHAYRRDRPARQIGTGPNDDKTQHSRWQASVCPVNVLGSKCRGRGPLL